MRERERPEMGTDSEIGKGVVLRRTRDKGNSTQGWMHLPRASGQCVRTPSFLPSIRQISSYSSLILKRPKGDKKGYQTRMQEDSVSTGNQN